MSGVRPNSRPRGNIEERGGALRVRLYAGTDPVTGRQSYLRATIPGTDKAAWRKADAKLAEFQTQVAKQRSAQSSVDLAYTLDEWLRTTELAESTRHTYEGYVSRTIEPALGDVAVNKLTARMLETFYTELRRCRARCDGKPRIDKHTVEEEHDCTHTGCKPHSCKPDGRFHGAPDPRHPERHTRRPERWDWISSNPARVARKPKQKRPEPDPPTPAEVARLSEKAFAMDDDWGTLVWLAMTTGMR